MAQSRLEKIGTVYSRVVSLIKGKALQEQDKPIWLEVYEAFPPKYEPRYDRQLPKKPVEPIFYEEDIIRARFHKDQKFIPITDLANESEKSATQNFLSIYKTIMKKEELPEDSAYDQAMRQYISEVGAKFRSKKIGTESSQNS